MIIREKNTWKDCGSWSCVYVLNICEQHFSKGDTLKWFNSVIEWERLKTMTHTYLQFAEVFYLYLLFSTNANTSSIDSSNKIEKKNNELQQQQLWL